MACLQKSVPRTAVVHYWLFHREPVRVPVRLWNKDHWARALHVGSDGRQRIPVYEVDEWSLFNSDFLNAIKALFAFLRIGCGGLCPHEFVDLRFPRCLRSLLRGIPLVILRRTQPD